MREEWYSYDEFIDHYAKQGFEILDHSSNHSWVRMFKINDYSQSIEIIYFGDETGVGTMSLSFEEVLILTDRLAL